jgi:hypothetical protein
VANEIPSPGIIPQSHALAEASPESIAELLSRDPEGYTRQNRNTIVLVMREQRVRWEAADAAEGAKPRGRSAGPKAQLASSTAAKADDLDL